MNYEKKYKETLEKAKDFLKRWECVEEANSNLVMEEVKDIFPELKESEDERMRRELVAFLKEELDTGGRAEETWDMKGLARWIAWLEKQGEKKPTDKVEPKFKVGDWITHNLANFAFKITNVDSCCYGVVNTENYKKTLSFDCAKENFHLWTIEDAKDGDVIVCDGKYGQEIGIVKKYIGKFGGCDKCFETYCFIDWDGIFRVGEYMGSRNILPATKEQRELLFKKMKEAGYKWDSENKELKKIETKGGKE